MLDQTLKKLLNRFEEMLASGKSIYLDADEYDTVIEYYDQVNNLDKAKYILSLGLDIHPDSELLLLRQARFMIYEKQYLETLSYLDKHFHSYEFDLFLLKIECYLSLNLYAEAYVLTQQVLSDSENDRDVILSELGYVYQETGYYKDAITYLEDSLIYNTDNTEVLSELIFIYESEDDYTKAIEYCDKLLNVDPYNADGWLLQGKLYSLIGNYEKAIDSFEFFSTIREDDIASLRLKTHCFILVERIGEAIDLLHQCIDIAPTEEVLYLSLIDCYDELEQYDDILKTVDLYHENQESPNAFFLAKKASACLKLNNNEDALEYIKKAKTLSDDSIEVNLIAIDIFSKIELYAEALDTCDAVLNLDKKNLLVLDKAVLTSISLNNYGRAIIYQERILDITQTVESRQKLVLLYLEKGDIGLFDECLEGCDNKTLLSVFHIFHKEELFDKGTLTRDFLLSELHKIYYSRIYYKSIRY